MFDQGLVVFSGEGCTACETLKATLKNKELTYKEYDIWKDTEALTFLMSQGLRGIPQLFLDGKLTKVEEI